MPQVRIVQFLRIRILKIYNFQLIVEIVTSNNKIIKFVSIQVALFPLWSFKKINNIGPIQSTEY